MCKTSCQNSLSELKPEVPLSIKLKETRDQRRLENYSKYQKIWEKYENKVDKHFCEKEQ